MINYYYIIKYYSISSDYECLIPNIQAKKDDTKTDHSILNWVLIISLSNPSESYINAFNL
jgi:hypothetical protein